MGQEGGKTLSKTPREQQIAESSNGGISLLWGRALPLVLWPQGLHGVSLLPRTHTLVLWWKESIFYHDTAMHTAGFKGLLKIWQRSDFILYQQTNSQIL